MAFDKGSLYFDNNGSFVSGKKTISGENGVIFYNKSAILANSISIVSKKCASFANGRTIPTKSTPIFIKQNIILAKNSVILYRNIANLYKNTVIILSKKPFGEKIYKSLIFLNLLLFVLLWKCDDSPENDEHIITFDKNFLLCAVNKQIHKQTKEVDVVRLSL